MKKDVIAAALIMVAVMGLGGCGLSASTTTGTATRTVTGTLSGDLAGIMSAKATNIADGTVYTSTLAAPKGKAELMAAGVSSYSFDLPVGSSYSITLEGAGTANAAVIQFPASASGSSATDVFNLAGNASGAVDLGNVVVPAGTGAAGVSVVPLEPENNPLEQNDLDGDGASDYDDADDDDDGVGDEADTDDNNDGVEDSEEETAYETPDTENSGDGGSSSGDTEGDAESGDGSGETDDSEPRA